ncbi:hypothetical protein F4782DRAFT_527798 [Xylaria castorea]|nr:hypothetical protein F4782DRAFT_527798 [Xylaria castorea]
MTKLLALLGVVLFRLTVIVSGVVLTDLYQETYQSLQSALSATAIYNNRDDDGQRVRKAMFSFFGIRNQVTKAIKPEVEEISLRINQIVDWLETQFNDIPRDRTFLFCGSDFLVQKDPATQALDYQGNGLVNTNGNPVPISQVPAYQADLAGGDVPWWSGERANIKGYYFTSLDDGAQTIVICPSAFQSTAPGTYSEAVTMTTAGIKLNLVVPKSPTLLHEAFHVVLGDEFLQANDEIYGLVECVRARQDPTKARKNPENYVYFIAAMHFLLGEPAEGITTNWEFAIGVNKAMAIN